MNTTPIADTVPRPLDHLADEITELCGHLNAANYRWLSLIAEFDRRKGWSDWATQSCAHWLNWKCGIAINAAREKVRVARALEELPKISEAMSKGQLSHSKVREMTRVACPATEDYLLMIALHGTAHHVETLVRHFRRAKESAELSREARQQANRFLGWSYDTDGSLILKARLPAETGAMLAKALHVALEELPLTEEDTPAGAPTVKLPTRTRRADALGMIAESFMAHGSKAMNGGDRHQIVLHIDAETLQHKVAGCCEIEDGPSIAAETARRIACDASIVTLIEDAEGEPLNVGRKTRTISPALRRALNARNRGCRFPGCSNTRFLDAHYLKHWADGGETKPSNLALMCRFHHRLVHEGSVTVQVLDDGALRFVRPDGQFLDSVAPDHTQPLTHWTEVAEQNRRNDLRIDKATAVTRWCGETMDYSLGVESLLWTWRKGRREAAAG
jgi:hypothetical protein